MTGLCLTVQRKNATLSVCFFFVWFLFCFFCCFLVVFFVVVCFSVPFSAYAKKGINQLHGSSTSD